MDKLRLFFVLLGICLIQYVFVAPVSAIIPADYNHTSATNISGAGYRPEHYTLELIGPDQIGNTDIEQKSWDLLQKFTTDFRSDLSSRWIGIAKK
jgi:hypothetical protein